MGGAVKPLADIVDVAIPGSVSLLSGGSMGIAGELTGGQGLSGGNPTGNPALGITAPMEPSKALIGMTAEEEQQSRNRAQVAASALAATNPQTKYRASSSLLGPDSGTPTTTG
jgi:hypothetical protein